MTDKELLDDYCTEIRGVGHKAMLTVTSLIASHREIRRLCQEQEEHIKYLHKRSEAEMREQIEQETRRQYATGLRELAATFKEVAEEMEKMASGETPPFS